MAMQLESKLYKGRLSNNAYYGLEKLKQIVIVLLTMPAMNRSVKVCNCFTLMNRII